MPDMPIDERTRNLRVMTPEDVEREYGLPVRTVKKLLLKRILRPIPAGGRHCVLRRNVEEYIERIEKEFVGKVKRRGIEHVNSVESSLGSKI
jgi:hypothetical protein